MGNEGVGMKFQEDLTSTDVFLAGNVAVLRRCEIKTIENFGSPRGCGIFFFEGEGEH